MKKITYERKPCFESGDVIMNQEGESYTIIKVTEDGSAYHTISHQDIYISIIGEGRTLLPKGGQQTRSTSVCDKYFYLYKLK